jgi:hypothetical protein
LRGGFLLQCNYWYMRKMGARSMVGSTASAACRRRRNVRFLRARSAGSSDGAVSAADAVLDSSVAVRCQPPRLGPREGGGGAAAVGGERKRARVLGSGADTARPSAAGACCAARCPPVGSGDSALFRADEGLAPAAAVAGGEADDDEADDEEDDEGVGEDEEDEDEEDDDEDAAGQTWRRARKAT